MFPAALFKAIGNGKMLQAPDTDRTINIDLNLGNISWKSGPVGTNTLSAVIESTDGNEIDTVTVFVPLEQNCSDGKIKREIPVGYECDLGTFGGDVRMSEATRRKLIEAGLKELDR